MNTDSAWIQFVSGIQSSKKSIIRRCLDGALRTKKYHVIDDIYFSIQKNGFSNPKGIDHFPYICLWLIDNIKGGEILDDCRIFSSIADYYRGHERERAIHYLTTAYEMAKSIYLEQIAASQIDQEVSRFYNNTGYLLVLDLIDAEKYELSIEYEKECIANGHFPVDARVMLHYIRFDAIRQYHKRKGDSILEDLEQAMFDKEFVADNDGCHIVATHLKYIGDEYYKMKDYETAFQYYSDAISAWPDVYGARTKMQYATSKQLKESQSKPKD